MQIDVKGLVIVFELIALILLLIPTPFELKTSSLIIDQLQTCLIHLWKSVKCLLCTASSLVPRPTHLSTLAVQKTRRRPGIFSHVSIERMVERV